MMSMWMMSAKGSTSLTSSARWARSDERIDAASFPMWADCKRRRRLGGVNRCVRRPRRTSRRCRGDAARGDAASAGAAPAGPGRGRPGRDRDGAGGSRRTRRRSPREGTCRPSTRGARRAGGAPRRRPRSRPGDAPAARARRDGRATAAPAAGAPTRCPVHGASTSTRSKGPRTAGRVASCARRSARSPSRSSRLAIERRAFRTEITGDDPSLLPDPARDERRLPSGCGAGVEDPVAGLRRERLHDERGGLILHREPTLVPSRERRRGRRRARGCTRDGPDRSARPRRPRRSVREDLLHGRSARVHAERERRRARRIRPRPARPLRAGGASAAPRSPTASSRSGG